MLGFTAANAVAKIEDAIGRHVDVVITNVKWPSPRILGRYALEHKEPRDRRSAPHVEVVGGGSGGARSLDTTACGLRGVGVLSRRLLEDEPATIDT